MDTKPKTFKVGHNEPALVRQHPAHPAGIQKLYRFPNGFGASVVRFPGSYGGDDGLWELAILKFTGPDIFNYKLTYDTPITGDVIGYLHDNEVEQYLNEIKTL